MICIVNARYNLNNIYCYIILKVSYSTVVSGDTSTDQENALSRIKQDLIEMSPMMKPHEALLCGRYCFQIIEKEGEEIIWSDIASTDSSKELAALIFGSIPKMAIESLMISNFWKVLLDSMSVFVMCTTVNSHFHSIKWMTTIEKCLKLSCQKNLRNFHFLSVINWRLAKSVV